MAIKKSKTTKSKTVTHQNPPITPHVRKVHPWSDYQKDIFHEIATGTGHVIVKAFAGASKSSTLIEGTYHVPKNKSVLLVCFNKIIQTELSTKVNPAITCLTLHSYGFSAARKRFGNVTLENDKVRNLIKNKYPSFDWDLQSELVKVVDFCKSTLAANATDVSNIIDKYKFETDPLNEPDFVKIVLETLDASRKQTAIIDYSDMIDFPVHFNLNNGLYDIVMIDEAQDLSQAQMKLALSAVKPGGRVIWMGDPWQSIYGFRAADSEATIAMIDALQPKVLTLPISYRLSLAVCKEVQKIVPDIQARPGATQGSVTTATYDEMYKKAKAGDFIISRLNAPLLGIALNFLKKGIRATVRGKDIGENLLVLIRKSKQRTLDGFMGYLSKWKSQEISRLVSLHKSPENVQDKYDCFEALSDGCSSLDDLKANINKLFSDQDDSKRIILGNVHKNKGLEAETVWILKSTFRQSNPEEIRVSYVGYSRAKEHLIFVTKK
jgi:DNA helicase II / ATP-dependent DNA helicase PcrA